MAIINSNDTYQRYSYILKELFIMIKGETIKLQTERLESIMIINDYIYNLFPIMRIKVTIDADLYFKIVKNKEDVKFKIRVQKFYRKNMDNFPSGLYEDYFSKTFSLILDDEGEDFNSELRKLQYGEKQTNDLFATKNTVEFFLFDSELMKTMKQTINIILKDGTVSSAIGYFASRLNITNLLMTKADNINTYDQLIIPPMKLSNALAYLDTFYGIHECGSIMYFGIERGYIIKYNGRCTAYEPNESKETTIIVPKTDSIMANNICQLQKAGQPKAKMIIADYNSLTFYDETVTKDILEGKEVRIINLYTGEIEDTLENDEDGRRKIITNRGENTYFKSIYKAQMTSSEAVITAVFRDIDLTCILPNKKFNFVFDDILLSRKYKGTYILAKSDILLVRESNELRPTVTCVFRKSLE